MDTNKIVKAAQAEYRAEQQKAQSESRWRAAWWRTTLALGAVTAAESKQAIETVRVELEQAQSYLQQRRRLGRFLAEQSLPDGSTILEIVDLATVETLPPKLSMTWVNQLKRGAEGFIETLVGFDEDKTSVRAFIQECGGVPMSTGKEGMTPQPRTEPAPTPTREQKIAAAREAMADPEIAREVVKTTPIAQRIAAVREVLADDEAATEVMRDVDTARAVRRAAGTAAAQEHEARQRDRDIADPKAAKEKAEDREQVGRMMARVNLESFLRHAKRDGISALACWGEIQGLASQVDRDLLLDILDEAMNPFAALKDALKTNHNIDAELAAFLAEGDD